MCEKSMNLSAFISWSEISVNLSAYITRSQMSVNLSAYITRPETCGDWATGVEWLSVIRSNVAQLLIIFTCVLF